MELEKLDSVNKNLELTYLTKLKEIEVCLFYIQNKTFFNLTEVKLFRRNLKKYYFQTHLNKKNIFEF